MTYTTQEQIIKDYKEGKINKWEKSVQLGKLGKNAKYFTEDELMCMYCDDLYTCDNNWCKDGKEKLEQCKKNRLTQISIR